MSQFTVKCQPDMLWVLEGFKTSSPAFLVLTLSPFFLAASAVADRTEQEGLLT